MKVRRQIHLRLLKSQIDNRVGGEAGSRDGVLSGPGEESRDDKTEEPCSESGAG